LNENWASKNYIISFFPNLLFEGKRLPKTTSFHSFLPSFLKENDFQKPFTLLSTQRLTKEKNVSNFKAVKEFSKVLQINIF